MTHNKNSHTDINICIVGLGYVGYPLLKLFIQKFNCIGIDTNTERVIEINNSNEAKCYVTSDWSENIIYNCNVYIVAVPTPTNKDHQPDTSALEIVCNNLGSKLKKGDLVIFESTVYPGATEELCVPILEKSSGLRLNSDFCVGYSPERINTGDKMHQIHNTPKIISASNSTALDIMRSLYGSLIEAPLVEATSIKVAEAEKMYENVQRDTLIALANEYSDYCRIEGIDIQEVTDCAATKWNFANVRPGLVGGHCIGVDAYYLLQRSSLKGISMPLVKTARSVNENKVLQVSDRIINFAASINKELSKIKVLILGFSYKPNTNDIRNTKISELIINLQKKFGVVDCYDPLVNQRMVKKTYGIELTSSEDLDTNLYDITILAVNHNCFTNLICKNTIKISDLL